MCYNSLNKLFESRLSVKPENKIKSIYLPNIDRTSGVGIFNADINALCYPRHLEKPSLDYMTL